MSDKPIAVLICDSITMGYRPLVQKSLSEKITVLGITENGGDSSQNLENLDERMINRGANLIHFNCGLHDLRFWKQRGDKKLPHHQQELDAYEANLRKIVERLQKETTARIVWGTTTPVMDDRVAAGGGVSRCQRDVEAYNQVATAIMNDAGVVIDDLHDVIQNDDVEACLGPDGVHMSERGSKLLSDTVCKCFLQQLGIS